MCQEKSGNPGRHQCAVSVWRPITGMPSTRTSALTTSPTFSSWGETIRTFWAATFADRYCQTKKFVWEMEAV
jgi:hypothetical protein